MTPATQRTLIDLGWVLLSQRALGLRVAEAHALRLLMRRPGRIVTFADLARDYEGHGPHRRTDSALRKRVERARAALADLGCADAIETVSGEKAYVVHEAGARRIEAALLFASGLGHAEAA